MARFDVYLAEGMPGYLLDCQADVLSDLSTRLAVPLLPPDHAPPPARRLNPTFAIGDEKVVMVTQFASSVNIRDLATRVDSLAGQHSAIMNALDMLLTGY